MKRKGDFITNSSSASFILTMRPHDGTMEIGEFTSLFNKFLDRYKESNPNGLRYWDGTNITDVINDESGPHLFEVTEWVSMYNDADDVPDYMKELMANSFIKDCDWGFVVSGFKAENDY
jgi:hypothetical protein